MPIVRLAVAAALSAALIPGATAQSKSNITHFTPSTVVKAITELGAKDAIASKRQTSDGKTLDVVSFTNAGIKHVAILAICNSPKGCLGLELLTIWGDNAGRTASRSALNTFNVNYGFGKGFVGPNNTLIYSRYAISDGGISMANLKANIVNFAGGSVTFQQFMAKNGSSGGEAALTPDGAAIHTVARATTPEADAVIAEFGASTGVNLLTIQSPTVPDVLPSKPAQ